MDSRTNGVVKDWVKVIIFALCTAIFFVLFYYMFIPQVGRYQVINEKEKDVALMFYIDTVTGRVYRLWDGKLRSSPH